MAPDTCALSLLNHSLDVHQNWQCYTPCGKTAETECSALPSTAPSPTCMKLYLTLRGDSTERPSKAHASRVKDSQISVQWLSSSRCLYGEFWRPKRRYTRLPIITWISVQQDTGGAISVNKLSLRPPRPISKWIVGNWWQHKWKGWGDHSFVSKQGIHHFSLSLILKWGR